MIDSNLLWVAFLYSKCRCFLAVAAFCHRCRVSFAMNACREALYPADATLLAALHFAYNCQILKASARQRMLTHLCSPSSFRLSFPFCAEHLCQAIKAAAISVAHLLACTLLAARRRKTCLADESLHAAQILCSLYVCKLILTALQEALCCRLCLE